MSEEQIKKMEDTGYCFACGKNNPIGLKLDFKIISNQFIAKTTVDKNYQSYGGVVHGGILTTMLDEAMGGYLFKTGEPAFTGKLEVRFRKPFFGILVAGFHSLREVDLFFRCQERHLADLL